jgi:hypothetical protein
MSIEQNRFQKDPVVLRDFLRTHSDLIEKYIALQRSDEYFRLPVRKEIADRAREVFGYSSATSTADIAYRILRKYKKAKGH